MLKDKKKLIILFIGVFIIICGLTGFITYYNPLFLYGITLGLMTFIYGYYHEDKKVNVSWNYAKAMGFVITIQWIILLSWITLFYFYRQIPIDDWPFANAFSGMITIYFLRQISRSDLKISNEKKEAIIGMGAILLFIVIFAFLILK